MRTPLGIVITLAAACFVGDHFINLDNSHNLFAADAAPPLLPDQEQPEVLIRGPVHEAFAQPVTFEVQSGLVIHTQPPADILEFPPRDKPQGEQFAWIPGYWSWDADRNDFVWVSACWRIAPPDMYWVPGYWAQSNDIREVNRGGVDVRLGSLSVHVGGKSKDIETSRWEWVSGFWSSTKSREIEYLPAPPSAVMDIESSSPHPDPDFTWVPGNWHWRDGKYARRPGYWLRQQPNWVWVPSHYRWTPRGHVFEAGHWDYPLERRGVLFAPIYLPPSVYSRSGVSYSPSIMIDMGMLSANMFAYPRYGHFYFGDYYDDAYLGAGIYPRFESERRHTWYDPIYTYDRWHNGRGDNHWAERQRQEYDHRRSDRDLRPERTYREMETRSARKPESQRGSREFARPIHINAGRQENRSAFERMNDESRHEVSRKATDVHRFRDERGKWESRREAQTPEHDSPHPGSPARPERVKVPDLPPTMGKPHKLDRGEQGPPSAPSEESRDEDHDKGNRQNHEDRRNRDDR